MKKIFKKSLAIMVSAAICLTALIGCLSVSAANGTGTFTVGSDTGKPGELVTVPIELAYTSSNGEDGMGIAASLFDVSFDTDALTITDIAAGEDATYVPDLGGVPGGEDVPPQDIYTVEYRSTDGETISVVDGAVRILAMPADNETVLTSMTVNLTFTINEGAAAQDYAITITEQQTCDYGQATPDGFGNFTYADDEEFIDMTITNGKITVVEDATGPVEIQEVLVAHSILLTESVGSQIAVNVGSINTLGYSDYYLSIDYKSYASGYILEDKTLTLNSNEYDRQNTSKTVSYFYFTKIALYEMPLEYTVTVFLKNNENEVVAYSKSTSSIQSQALAYAQKYSTDIKLLTTLVDMVNYGAAAQTFFAQLNPGSDIVDALLPTNGFEAYQQYASSTDDLPESFNTIKEIIKDVPETTLVPTATILIGASNSIQYKFMANNYDSSKLSLEVSYLDSYGTLQEATVPFTDLAVQQSGDNTIYTYVYSDLAIYDLEKTVTVKIVNNGITELTYKYSVGNFVNANIGNTSFADILTKMELFSQSARIKLVGE